MNYVLGIDGGATKTVSILIDTSGKIHNRFQTGPSAYQNLGITRSIESIVSSINGVTMDLEDGQVVSLCVGLAGLDRQEDKSLVRENLHKLLLKNPINGVFSRPFEITIEHDTLIALTGGIGDHFGIVVIAGTGSIVFGVNKEGRSARAGGWGSFLGDDGSAYQIAHKGLRAALRSYDGRIGKTSLITKFMDACNIKKIEDLMYVIYQNKPEISQIAQFAKLVDEAAFEGDKVAQNIIDESVEELRISTGVVIDDLFTDFDEFNIVTSGGVWQSKSGLREKYIQAMANRVQPERIIFPRFEPAYGAGLIALKALNVK